MARLNGGGWAAGILVAVAIGGGLMMLAAGEERRAFEARFAEATIEGRAFGLACRETRPPNDCEGLCRALFEERAAWAECVKAVVDPRLVSAPGPDPAPDLEGGPSPDECEGLAPEICG